MSNPYRQLPAVSQLLDHPDLAAIRSRFPAPDLTLAVRQQLDSLRQRITTGQPLGTHAEADNIVQRVIAQLERTATPNLRSVINATGIVLHTNLGRSPMHESAAHAAYSAARGYLNLELELETGKRSSRQNPIREGVKHLTHAEAATVVNNCAAATVIVLRAIAAGKDVIVSRGQLIEIGGSFRIPDILVVSGCSLREVGTTNITRISDYEQAIGPNTGAIMRIHTSNYRVRGFTKSATLEELVALGQKHNVPVIDDAGSGSAVELTPFGLGGEPLVSEGIDAGADLVLFSGDKLLGGPQAGIIAGKKKWIEQIEKDPLMRAFRLDKMTLAALEATLRLYRDPAEAIRTVPTLRMLTMPLAELRTRSERVAERLQSVGKIEVKDDIAYVGGGSLPDVAIPTIVIAIQNDDLGETEFATRLRTSTPAVMSRVQDGKLLLDLRTVFEHQEGELVAALVAAGARRDLRQP
jgi:L-seryl-tRNA(Ser) seleniumtransferase